MHHCVYNTFVNKQQKLLTEVFRRLEQNLYFNLKLEVSLVIFTPRERKRKKMSENKW